MTRSKFGHSGVSVDASRKKRSPWRWGGAWRRQRLRLSRAGEFNQERAPFGNVPRNFECAFHKGEHGIQYTGELVHGGLGLRVAEDSYPSFAVFENVGSGLGNVIDLDQGAGLIG